MKYKIFFALIASITIFSPLNAMTDFAFSLNDPWADDIYELNPFFKAIHRKDVAHVNQIIADGADVNKITRDETMRDPIYRTPLNAACDMASPDVALALIKAGATIKGKDRNGKTLLHWAAAGIYGSMEDRIKIVQVIINANPSLINERNEEGETPLMKAAHTLNPGLVETLLRANASALPRRPHDQKSALDIAFIKQQEKQRMLKNFHAHPNSYHPSFPDLILEDINKTNTIILLLSQRSNLEINIPRIINGTHQIEGNRKGRYRNKPRTINRLKDETKKEE
jgi:ankyrin repeat protein